MDDRAIEELCKWHDEQVARLESQDATAGTARAIEMHAKTSVALLEAMAEIRRLRSDCRAGRQRLRCGNQHQVRPQHQPDSRADLLGVGARSGVVFLVWLVFETMGWL